MRITEAQLRRIIREALTPPNFRSPTRHSSGWIDPAGEYHFDPKLPDHGEWALSRLLDLKMQDVLLDRTRAAVARSIRNGDTELQMPEGDDIIAIHAATPWIVEDAAIKILLSMGWAKVSNAYTIQAQHLTPQILETWMNLGMESGADPEMEHTVWTGDQPRRLAGWDGIERLMRKIR